MTPLYSLRTDGDQYRITKFVDGDMESSYLCTESECECPAGHRHTCRHRQMLPTMLAHKLANTHWFFAFDTGGQIVDFNGTPKKLYDELTLASAPVPEGQHCEEDTYGRGPMMNAVPQMRVDNERKRKELVDQHQRTEAILDRAMGADADSWQKLEQTFAPTHPLFPDIPLTTEPIRERTPLPKASWRRL